jgi:protoheme IX farnesyltransferase
VTVTSREALVSGADARADAVAPPALRPRGALALAGAYFELTKPRIVMLITITGVPALLMAKRAFPGASTFWGALAGIALAASSAAVFNQVIDRDIDGLMHRTRTRPLPAGKLTARAALVFAWALAALAFATLLVFGNVLAAAIGMLSIVYYAVIYSIGLKRRTPQNIVIGGGAGASAPLIAWAAVTGTLGAPAWVLAAIVFLWTPPHFWALALYRREDYQRAGIPMLPVTHGEPETRRQILIYAVVLVPATLALVPLGAAGAAYAVPAAVLGAVFIAQAAALRRSASTPDAVRLFRFSILYLFLLFLALIVDAVLRAGAGA